MSALAGRVPSISARARAAGSSLVRWGTANRTLGAGGALTDLKVFARRGGESVAVGPDGRVYVANGQIFVYDKAGTAIGRIDVPERPINLLFGGPDGRTLFILTHHTLYSVEPQQPK